MLTSDAEKSTGDLEVPGSYMPQIDSLRSISVIMVMWSHWMPLHYQLRLPWGHFGVQTFFVISGFLITGILLRAERGSSDGKCNIQHFYIRRALRILPAFYILLIALWFLDFGDTRESFLWHAFFLTNFWICFTNSFNTWLAHFWTLAVEEQFYLLWPWLVRRASRQSLSHIALGCIAFSLIFRATVPILTPQLETTVLLPSVWDALAVGALIALPVREGICTGLSGKFVFWLIVFSFFCLQATASVHSLSIPLESLRQTTMLLFIAKVVSRTAASFDGAAGSVLGSTTLQRLGKISYGLYLYHHFVPHLFRWLLESVAPEPNPIEVLHPLILFSVYFAITVLIASLSWTLFERNALILKRRFPQSVSSAPSPSHE
ncbi:acyltransferase [Rubripirellula amarantea]|nr:acyltransferase [Rubripirellula amarantea]